MQSKNWERRLEDLGFILEACCSTYLDPDIFRRNTNQFLQIARTVTFLIQKDKNSIPNFDDWYISNVQDAWKNDPIMIWAKNSRNIIEKQGDLELHSSLDVSLVFSYLTEEDIHIQVGREELLNFGIKKLVRFAQKELPTGISDAASVRIVRKWITANLADWELVNALVYVYGRHYAVFTSLCRHLGYQPSRKIVLPTNFEALRTNLIGPTYLKLRGMNYHRLNSAGIEPDEGAEQYEKLKNVVSKVSSNIKKIDSPDNAMEYFRKVAYATFSEWGYHVPILHIFDENWNLIDLLSTKFEDQADKYFFWRMIGEKVENLNAGAIVWICELWQRKTETYPCVSIRNLPIIGEGLHIVLIHKDGSFQEDGWSVKRDENGNNPFLDGPSKMISNENVVIPNYLAPVCRAMGGAAERKFNELREQYTKK